MTDPEKRLRLQHFLVQPFVVWDDGEEITPGPPMSTNTLTLSGLAEMVERWPVEFAALREQLESAVIAEAGSESASDPEEATQRNPEPSAPSSPAA